jgi:hypothetical protein
LSVIALSVGIAGAELNDSEPPLTLNWVWSVALAASATAGALSAAASDSPRAHMACPEIEKSFALNIRAPEYKNPVCAFALRRRSTS